MYICNACAQYHIQPSPLTHVHGLLSHKTYPGDRVCLRNMKVRPERYPFSIVLPYSVVEVQLTQDRPKYICLIFLLLTCIIIYIKNPMTSSIKAINKYTSTLLPIMWSISCHDRFLLRHLRMYLRRLVEVAGLGSCALMSPFITNQLGIGTIFSLELALVYY